MDNCKKRPTGHTGSLFFELSLNLFNGEREVAVLLFADAIGGGVDRA
jgi:hypothetical protein